MRLLLLLLLLSGSVQVLAQHSNPTRFSSQIANGEAFQGIRLLGAISLRGIRINGQTLAGLSALAWDEDEQLLYAVSDKGAVFHLRPVIKNNLLRSARVIAGYPLTDIKGRALSYPWHDAEGLTLQRSNNQIRGDSRLLVSYEVRPRVRVYQPDGTRLGGELLPARLENIRNYYGRNSALESTAVHPDHGLLVAPQRPLRRSKGLRIYAQNGRSWSYKISPIAGNSLASMEILPDGSLLMLERAFVGITKPLVITLRRAELGRKAAHVQTIASLSSHKGWRLDNFEGLAYHQQQRFFMVSDDNGNFWQSNLLVYLELLDSPDS